MKCNNCDHEFESAVPRAECPECGETVSHGKLNYKSPVVHDDEDDE